MLLGFIPAALLTAVMNYEARVLAHIPTSLSVRDVFCGTDRSLRSLPDCRSARHAQTAHRRSATCFDMHSPALISITGLSHSYGQGALAKQVLHNINIDFYPGEIAIIMGPSGGGKTTLLSLAGALRSVQSGSIRLDGVELRNASSRKPTAGPPQNRFCLSGPQSGRVAHDL